MTTASPHRPRVSFTRRFVLSTVVMLVAGVAGGLAWLALADPPGWEVRSNGIVLTEEAAKGQFSVIVVFVLIGAILSLLGGVAVTWTLRDLGWVVAPVVVVGTLVAAVIAWRIGADFGPPNPATVTGTSIGQLIPAELKIDGVAPFLVWPIAGLVGLIFTLLASAGDDEDQPVAPAPPL